MSAHFGSYTFIGRCGIVKLHVGCGNTRIPGFVNIDAQNSEAVDLIARIESLPLKENSCDEIYSCANIEHFGRSEWQDVLAHWCSRLRPGGSLYISTADFEACAVQYLSSGNIAEVTGLVIGGQKDSLDWHGMIFDKALLTAGLLSSGFVDVERFDWRDYVTGQLEIDDFSQAYLPHMDKENGRHMMLNLRAVKPRKVSTAGPSPRNT